jgi:1,4-dihydroxy-6-naphthoate synthase
VNTPLTLGFSPCPNDCFIFDAMLHGKVDTEGLTFAPYMLDVETLNTKAINGDLDITKLSYHAYAYLTDKYHLLNAGSALGRNCGPLLITNSEDIPALVSGLRSGDKNIKVAIPGKLTTANFLFSLAFPLVTRKVEIVFSGIEDAVLIGLMDAGLIIHENRFTYEQKGLKKIIDLGEYWETMAKAPIPLGGIVVKRSFPLDLKRKIDRVLRRSVEYAFANPKASLPFVKQHAQEMSEEVMYKHINLYVNDFSIDLGTEGKRAIKIMFDKAHELGIVTASGDDIFLTH